MTNGQTITSITIAAVVAAGALWEYVGRRKERKAIEAQASSSGLPPIADDTQPPIADDTQPPTADDTQPPTADDTVTQPNSGATVSSAVGGAGAETTTEIVSTEQPVLTLPLYSSLRPSTIATAMGSGIVYFSGYGTNKFPLNMVLVGSAVILGATEYTGKTTLIKRFRN